MSISILEMVGEKYENMELKEFYKRFMHPFTLSITVIFIGLIFCFIIFPKDHHYNIGIFMAINFYMCYCWMVIKCMIFEKLWFKESFDLK